ncbi:MAG: hypothetical protein AB8A39_06150, partial [Prochlorococcus sp.]
MQMSAKSAMNSLGVHPPLPIKHTSPSQAKRSHNKKGRKKGHWIYETCNFQDLLAMNCPGHSSLITAWLNWLA